MYKLREEKKRKALTNVWFQIGNHRAATNYYYYYNYLYNR